MPQLHTLGGGHAIAAACREMSTAHKLRLNFVFFQLIYAFYGLKSHISCIQIKRYEN